MATQAYVTQQYQELLGRAPDAGGLRHYMGYSNPAEVRSSILGSAEYRRRAGEQSSPAPTAAAGPTAAEAEAAKWNKEGDSQYNQLGAFDKNAQNPLDMYNSALNSLGIADVRTRVSDLRTSMINTENMLRAVDPNVSQRTSNSLVTEAQRQRLVAQERAPLDEALRTQGQNFDAAQGDYKMVLDEGKTQAELAYKGQQDKRQAIIDRLKLALTRADSATAKAKWEKEIKLQEAKMAEEKRQFEANYALEVQKFNESKAQAARSSSSGGGSSSSSSSNKTNWDNVFVDYIKGQMKSAPYSSRQAQDSWANAWFAQNGVSSTSDRQHYWDLFNSTWNRPANPYSDPFYKK